MSSVQQRLQENLGRIRQRIEDACRRVGRDPQTVGLVAVTKYARLEWVQFLPILGVHQLGENRPQQLVERAPLVPGVQWHLIGQLQRNKVRSVLPHTVLIHSVDSQRLLERISLIAGEMELRPRVLLQVNVSGEASKQGFTSAELLEVWPQIARIEHVEIDGLMTMAPLTDDPETARPTFRGLRELQDQLRRSAGSDALPVLSMGMSDDMEVAVEEGATLVRIGSALFDGLE